jgi:hypothetical protein
MVRCVQTVMPYLHETLRQDVLREAAEKLDAGEGRGRAILCCEGDEISVAREQPSIRDAETMSIASEVREHVLRLTKRALRVHDPTLSREFGHHASEGKRVAKVVEAGEDAASIQLVYGIKKFASKQSAENADWKQKLGPADPVGAVRRQTTGRDDRV